MSRSIRTVNISFCTILLVSVVKPGAAETQMSHPRPWPIRHWRYHQPRRSELTPEQNQKIDRFYSQLEKENPKLIAPDFRPK